MAGTVLKMFPVSIGVTASLFGFGVRLNGGISSAIGSIFEVPSIFIMSVILVAITLTALLGLKLFNKYQKEYYKEIK